jgi:glycosyltransferase involved in cell wall biosynthesis
VAGSGTRQRTALIVTVLDEAETIDALMASIASQTVTPDEVVVVDGGSSDGTWERLERWSLAAGNVRLVRLPGASISTGRNAAIRATTCEVIAVTDAGVRLEPTWLARLLECLSPDVDVVAGFFKPDPCTTFERAMGATVLPDVSDVKPARFLPSSRSVLFRRRAWERVGGYPEWLDYCEDVVFDLALREQRPFAFAPDAVAWFRPRGSLGAFFRQYYRYARGDGKADLWRGRHATRYLTYLLAPVLLRRGRLGAGLVVLGSAAYVRRPYQRLVPLLAGLSPRQQAYAVMLVPALRLVGDVAKMLGYPAGVLWRLRQSTSRSSS